MSMLAGVLLAAAIVAGMRALEVRWSWATVALAAPVLLPSLFGAWATPLTIALCWAAVRGLVLHRRDLSAGADLARAAAARPGPADAFRALAAALARVRAGRRPWLAGGRLVVGRGRGGEPVSIPFAGPHGGEHTLILGATGSGKTVTETWIAARAIEAGMGAVAVDPKGDHRLRAELAHAARIADRRLIEWTPEGPAVYNPFACGSPSSIADRALAGETFTEPHYLRQAQRYLLHVARTLQSAGETVCLRSLAEHLDPDRLERLATSLPGEGPLATNEYLDSLTARQRADLGGVRDRLSILVESDAGPWLDPRTSGGAAFDLAGAIAERAVVYFGLRADRLPLLAPMLAAAIVEDLLRAAATLRDGERRPTVVVLDEFSSLDAIRVASAFARARDAGLNLVLATQELADLRLPGAERVADQIQGNLATILAHRQVVPDSIDRLVRLAGRRGAWRTSRDSRGGWRAVRSEEPRLDAELLTGLPPGQAVVIELAGRRSARLAAMHSPDASPRGTP